MHPFPDNFFMCPVVYPPYSNIKLQVPSQKIVINKLKYSNIEFVFRFPQYMYILSDTSKVFVTMCEEMQGRSTRHMKSSQKKHS